MNNFFKRTVLIMGLIALFTSCNSDDDDKTSTISGSDPLIGTWKYVASNHNGEIENLDDCDRTNIFTFSENGDFLYIEHTIKDDELGCQELFYYNGKWLNDNGTYIWKYNSRVDPETGVDRTDEGEFEEEYTIFETTFKNDTLIINDDDGFIDTFIKQ